MTSPAYARGFTGLAEHLGVTAKTARAIDKQVKFPKVEIPGIIRPTTLFKISDIDEALAKFRIEVVADAPLEEEGTLDLDKRVSEIAAEVRRTGRGKKR